MFHAFCGTPHRAPLGLVAHAPPLRRRAPSPFVFGSASPQDKNCIAIPKALSAWAAPAPFELKPRGPTVNTYLALTLNSETPGARASGAQRAAGAPEEGPRALLSLFCYSTYFAPIIDAPVFTILAGFSPAALPDGADAEAQREWAAEAAEARTVAAEALEVT